MKLGADNKIAVAALIGLALLTSYIGWNAFGPSGDKPVAIAVKSPQPAAANAPAPGNPRGGRATRSFSSSNTASSSLSSPSSTLDPTLRFDLLKFSEARTYDGGRRNIFQEEPEPIPTPVTNGTKQAANLPVGPPPVPPPPPINLKFFGFASRPGETKKIFLSNGDDVFIGAEGDIVSRRYKIIRIGSSAVEIEDVLNNNRQTIPLIPG